jgi:hypothetical protein
VRVRQLGGKTARRHTARGGRKKYWRGLVLSVYHYDERKGMYSILVLVIHNSHLFWVIKLVVLHFLPQFFLVTILFSLQLNSSRLDKIGQSIFTSNRLSRISVGNTSTPILIV